MVASTSASAQIDSIASSGDSNSSGLITPAHLTAALSAVAPNRKAVVVPTVIPINTGAKPKLDAHLFVNPKELVKVNGRSREIFMYGGYQYLRDKPIKSANATAYACQQKRKGCSGRIYVYPDNKVELRSGHTHDPSNTLSKVYKVSVKLS